MAPPSRRVAVPTAEEVRSTRLSAGLTQTEACELTHLKSDTRWSEYEHGTRNMDLARWELFLIKINQHPLYIRRRSPGRKTNLERQLEKAQDPEPEPYPDLNFAPVFG